MNITDFKRLLNNLWGDKKPICLLFETKRKYYLYDVGTNKILICGDNEYQLIKNLLTFDIDVAISKTLNSMNLSDLKSTIDEINNKIEGEDILKAVNVNISAGVHFNDLEGYLKKKLSCLQLEVTDKCNLSCKYCIRKAEYEYQRSHGNGEMGKETAFRAIDYFIDNSKEAKDIAITFYGGEPLLNLRLIKDCVKYARQKETKQLHFSITTNATLMDHTIAKYLKENNFSIMASIDGPQEIHDSWRTTKNNARSFYKSIRGLKSICDVFEKETHRISISMVYTPPYSEIKVERVASLWQEYPWIPRKIPVNITYPRPGSIQKGKYWHGESDYSLYNWSKKEYINSYLKSIICHPIAKAVIEKNMAILIQRTIHNKPQQAYYLNGCCVPGGRKLFVSKDGEYSLCEKIEGAPIIGNVNDGIDIQLIKEAYINEYLSKSQSFCKNCWCLRLCGICYMHAFKNNEIDVELKNKYCESGKNNLLNNMSLFCQLLEINENGLNHLYNTTIK